LEWGFNMSNIATIKKDFSPLTHEEKALNSNTPTSNKENWEPIIPVPKEAPKAGSFWKKPHTAYEYKNQKGELLGYVLRYENKDGKNTIPFTYCYNKTTKDYAWQYKGWKEPRPLYGLEQFREKPATAKVLITEGEKACDASKKLYPDCVCLTSPFGSNSPQKADWIHLKDREIYIAPDHDETGEKYAEKVATIAVKIGAKRVHILSLLPDKKDGWDIADGVQEGWTQKQATEYLKTAKIFTLKPKIPAGFENQKTGIYFVEEKENGDFNETWICSKLEIICKTRNEQGENWGRLLRWKDGDGRVHTWAMPMELLSKDGSELRGILLDRGLSLSSVVKAKNKLLEYIQLTEVYNRAISVEKIGWNNGYFVFPEGIIPKTPDIFLQSENYNYHAFYTKGSLEDWQNNVCYYAMGNSRLILSLCIAFAPPLLKITGEENGGFHLIGNSSIGKSTALNMASSVWGGGKHTYIQQWRTTSNALEATAESHNDCLLCLDELGQSEGREAGETAYMLANGTGKNRMRGKGGLRKKSFYRTIFLSNGEISLSDKVEEAGKKIRAGMEIRMVDIPADTGVFGIFENIHGFDNGDKFARHLKEKTQKHYGIAIQEFISKLTAMDFEKLKKDAKQTINEFVSKVVKSNADGQVRRVAGRFGLALYAGLLARKMEILHPIITEKEIFEAIEKCFHDWLEQRGTIGNMEAKRILEQVDAFFEIHGASRFSMLKQTYSGEVKEDDEKIHNRAGYKDEDGNFFVFKEIWKSEVCRSLGNLKDVNKTLIMHKRLVSDKQGKASITKHIKGIGLTRIYHYMKGKELSDG